MLFESLKEETKRFWIYMSLKNTIGISKKIFRYSSTFYPKQAENFSLLWLQNRSNQISPSPFFSLQTRKIDFLYRFLYFSGQISPPKRTFLRCFSTVWSRPMLITQNIKLKFFSFFYNDNIYLIFTPTYIIGEGKSKKSCLRVGGKPLDQTSTPLYFLRFFRNKGSTVLPYDAIEFENLIWSLAKAQ